jgi:hypothetical protein
MTNGIYTLHDYMLRTESITYLLIVVVLVGFPIFWKFLSEREDDASDEASPKHPH